MKLRNLISWNSTLSVESIDVLRDDMLQVSLVHELNESHVTLGGLSLNESNAKLSLCSWLVLKCAISSRLLNVGELFPAACSGWENSVGSRPVVWDTSSCGKTCTSEGTEVLRLENPTSEFLSFFLKFEFGIEIFLLFFFGFQSGISHFRVVVCKF